MFRYLELVCFPLDTHLLLVCNYKALLLFFDILKIFEKLQKFKKPKTWTGKDVIFSNNRVMSPLNKALYITSIGWVYSLTLGVVLQGGAFFPNLVS